MTIVAIVYKEPPETVQVKPRGSTKFEFLTSIYYSEPLVPKRYHAEREATEKKAVEVSKLLKVPNSNLISNGF